MKKIYLIIMTLILSGCIGGSSAPSTFYMLKSQNNAAESNKAYRIAVEPVKIPTYLDRPQIVTFKADTFQLTMSETNRWAEPLSEQIQRTLINDLASLLPKSSIRTKTFSAEKYNYILYVDINKLDSTFDDQTILSVWWSLLNEEGQTIYRTQTNLKLNLGDSYEDLVANQSALIAQLSLQIAKKIISLK